MPHMAVAMDEMLMTADAARVLDVTPAMIRLLERQGKLKAVRTMSGVRLFPRAEVMRVRAERDARAHAAGERRARPA